MKCSVWGCKSRKENLSFFKFPRNKKILKKWTAILDYSSLLDELCDYAHRHFHICELHFTAFDIKIRDNKKVLRKTAVPSLKLHEKRKIQEKINLKIKTEKTKILDKKDEFKISSSSKLTNSSCTLRMSRQKTEFLRNISLTPINQPDLCQKKIKVMAPPKKTDKKIRLPQIIIQRPNTSSADSILEFKKKGKQINLPQIIQQRPVNSSEDSILDMVPIKLSENNIEYTESSINLTCIMCLKNKGYISVHEIVPDGTTITELLKFIYSITVRSNDLPQFLCFVCHKEVTNTYDGIKETYFSTFKRIKLFNDELRLYKKLCKSSIENLIDNNINNNIDVNNLNESDDFDDSDTNINLYSNVNNYFNSDANITYNLNSNNETYVTVENSYVNDVNTDNSAAVNDNMTVTENDPNNIPKINIISDINITYDLNNNINNKKNNDVNKTYDLNNNNSLSLNKFCTNAENVHYLEVNNPDNLLINWIGEKELYNINYDIEKINEIEFENVAITSNILEGNNLNDNSFYGFDESFELNVIPSIVNFECNICHSIFDTIEEFSQHQHIILTTSTDDINEYFENYDNFYENTIYDVEFLQTDEIISFNYDNSDCINEFMDSEILSINKENINEVNESWKDDEENLSLDVLKDSDKINGNNAANSLVHEVSKSSDVLEDSNNRNNATDSLVHELKGLRNQLFNLNRKYR